jgi:hypothetical protein
MLQMLRSTVDAGAPAQEEKKGRQGRRQQAAAGTSSDKDIRELRIQKVAIPLPLCMHAACMLACFIITASPP